jgi:hypothetical protein
MISWLSVIAVAIIIVVASWWKTRDRKNSASDLPEDPGWGDWPSDQMAP